MGIVKKNSEIRPFYSNLLDEFLNSGVLPYAENEKRSGIPALNVREDDKTLILEVRVPGIKKEDIKIDYKDGFLTLSGEAKDEKEEKEGKKYLRREFSSYSFHRTIELPEEKYNVAKAEASYKDGILEVTMPRNEETKKLNKTIEVK